MNKERLLSVYLILFVLKRLPTVKKTSLFPVEPILSSSQRIKLKNINR